MTYRFRLLPVLVAAAALLFCAKVADIWFAIGSDPISAAQAQAAPPQQAEAPTHVASAKAPSRDPSQFSPQEVQLLQSLAQRRDELDKRASEIDQRDALLQAAEQRINEKIAKLSTMEKTIDAAFKKQDQLDDTKLKSLVKIYETMKPKEA